MLCCNHQLFVSDERLIDSGVTPLFVIPHERERENVEDVVGDGASVVFITTPGQVRLC